MVSGPRSRSGGWEVSADIGDALYAVAFELSVIELLDGGAQVRGSLELDKSESSLVRPSASVEG